MIVKPKTPKTPKPPKTPHDAGAPSKTKTPYRILSMDGGPAAPSYLRMLRKLEESQPGFLDSVDMFVGASDGAWAALYLASRPARMSALARLDGVIQFNEDVAKTLKVGFWGALRLFSGLSSAIDNDASVALLERTFGTGHTGESITLGELNHDVVIVSFRVRSRASKPGPRFYHNLARTEEEEGGRAGWTYNDMALANLGMPASEVALRSGSVPVMMPVRDGFVDGGLFANNPAMCGVAQLLQFGASRGVDGPEDIILLSVGADLASTGGPIANRVFFRNVNVKWGWMQWLLMPWAPLLLLETMMSASGRGVAFQTRQILGKRFLRLAPPLPSAMATNMLRLIDGHPKPMFDEADAQAEAWASGELGISYRPNFFATSRWLNDVWFGDTGRVLRVTDTGDLVTRLRDRSDPTVDRAANDTSRD